MRVSRFRVEVNVASRLKIAVIALAAFALISGPAAPQTSPAPPAAPAAQSAPPATVPQTQPPQPIEGASAPQPAAPQPVPGAAEIAIGYLRLETKPILPLSRLDVPPQDLGIAGANLGLLDNNTTGRFTKQHFTLKVESVPVGQDPLPALKRLTDAGIKLIVVDGPKEGLLKISDAARDQQVLLFNVRAIDDDLRAENCRVNVLHTAPSRSMLADALAQYLVWKKWPRWFLVSGVLPPDIAYANAIKHAAKKFGGKIVEERSYKEQGGSRRSDTGHALVQKQLPVFTQGAPAFDVMIVADESEVFGAYMPYRTWDPRPVTGTAGLVATSWHPAHEQWGATQMQNRFERLAKRWMLPVDYQAWMAIRTIGEAATRVKSAEFRPILEYVRSPNFDLAAFKGQKLTYRIWDGQLRQPILLADLKMLVSVSPQEGFLHQKSELDTLGIDQPETKCKMN